MSAAPSAVPFVLEGKVPLVTADIRIGTRDWHVTAVQNEDLLLDSAEDLEHFPFGFLLWESAVGLARYMSANPQTAAGRKMLELGAGVGVAGMVARSLGADVRQTDHQKGALQLAQRNAAQNAVPGIDQFLADWRHWKHAGRYDILIGADITYERDMHFYLEDIFDRNLAPGGAILLSDPGRPQSLEFAVLLEKKGWRIAMEKERVSLMEHGQAGGPVDVVILCLTR